MARQVSENKRTTKLNKNDYLVPKESAYAILHFAINLASEYLLILAIIIVIFSEFLACTKLKSKSKMKSKSGITFWLSTNFQNCDFFLICFHLENIKIPGFEDFSGFY